MIKDYYKILGIQAGADKKEIKRAYFKQVKLFSPEKDPEKFQEIREAYENLMDDDRSQVSVQIPKDPLAEQMMERIRMLMKRKDYYGVMNTAEEAQRMFGESEGFLYYLALAQRLAGNTGNSVKSFERLIVLFPDKLLHRREIAISYLERGYGKKAYAAFERAYDSGCRDDDFLLMFSMCAHERNQDRKCEEVLLSMVEKERRNLRDSMEEQLEAFSVLFMLNATSECLHFSEAIAAYEHFLKNAAAYVKEYEEEIFYTTATLLMSGTSKNEEDSSTIERIVRELDSRMSDGRLSDLILALSQEKKKEEFCKDDRLSDTMKMGYEAYMDAPELYGDVPQILRFIVLDCNLCILEEWPSNQAQFQIIKEEYPDFYESIRELHEYLENGKQEMLRTRYIKEYDRLYTSISGSAYYERYPHRRRGAGEIKWDSAEEGSFVRSGKKVGRNDPCPCGSGKKYKNCCGRN